MTNSPATVFVTLSIVGTLVVAGVIVAVKNLILGED